MRTSVALLILAFASLPAAQEKLPDGKGKETLENTCTECHGLDKVLSRLRTQQRWRSIAVEMRSKGATMTDSELNTLVEYLYQNFGTDEEKVNVNKATAKELETELALTAKESDAIVHYRNANGPFKAWRDLTKVAGVDRSKIEARKDRLTF